MTIKPGDIVIMHDWDEPSARMCAVVMDVYPSGACDGVYLTTFPGRRKCGGDRPTLVTDFGQRVEFSDQGTMRVVPSGESRAKYGDGSPRQWQDREPGTWWECHEDALLLLVHFGRAAAEAIREAVKARPLSEWHEGMGDKLWWRFPITEAPYVGSPLDAGRTVEVVTRYLASDEDGENPEVVERVSRYQVGGWPGYHTHFTDIPTPIKPDEVPA